MLTTLLIAAAAQASFIATLERHVAAIPKRDYAEIEATITKGDRLELILPNGKRMTTRAEFLAFHREFFADKGWSMRFERQSLIEGKDIAFATYRTYFSSSDDGKPVNTSSWLTLTFRKEGGEWRLVHDQNTRIPAS